MRALVLTSAIAALALAGCGHKADTTANTTATTTTTTTTTSTGPATMAGAEGLPVDCQTYFTRVDALATRLGGAAAAQYRQAMAQSRAQWDAMPNKADAAPACRQALAMLDQQSAMMNQMGRH